MKCCLYYVLIIMLVSACGKHKKTSVEQDEKLIGNPLMEGYFADPCILKEGDTFYIYATIDPWGGDELAVFSTTSILISLSKTSISVGPLETCD